MRRVVDGDTLLDMVDGDHEFFNELVSNMLSYGKQLVSELALAVTCDDLEWLRTTAHTLKGTAGNFRIHRVAHAAAELEQECASGDLQAAANLVAHVQDEWERFAQVGEHMVRLGVVDEVV